MRVGDIIYFHKDFNINKRIYGVGLYEIIEWGSLFIALRKLDDSGNSEVIRELNDRRILDYFYTLNEYREFKISQLID